MFGQFQCGKVPVLINVWTYAIGLSCVNIGDGIMESKLTKSYEEFS